MGPDTTVVTLQNGMGNAEDIARIIPADRIYVGPVSYTHLDVYKRQSQCQTLQFVAQGNLLC